MTYVQLFKEAEELVERERKEYGLKKLTDMIKRINRQKTFIERQKKTLTDLETELKDLCAHEVSYPDNITAT